MFRMQFYVVMFESRVIGRNKKNQPILIMGWLKCCRNMEHYISVLWYLESVFRGKL